MRVSRDFRPALEELWQQRNPTIDDWQVIDPVSHYRAPRIKSATSCAGGF
jgi:hypothetical protein